MAKSLETIAGRLERVTAQFERAAKRNAGPGLGGAIRPFLLGALLGAGAALLYAPKAGEETREGLRRNAGDLQGRATEAASGAKGRLPEQLKGAQERAQALLARTKAQGESAVSEATDAPDTAKTGAGQGANPARPGAKRAGANGSRGERPRAQLRHDLVAGDENPS